MPLKAAGYFWQLTLQVISMDPQKTTYHHTYSDWETVIGDEKQTDFLPRVKIKKWNNEVNLSIGLKDLNGVHTVEADIISYETSSTKAVFYPVHTSKPLDNSKIR